MQVLIIGAAGMVGRKLTTCLLEEGHLGGRQKTNLVLHDIVTPEAPQSAPFEVATLCSDFSMPDEAEKLIESRLDTIFYLAAIASGEADFDKGYPARGLHATRFLRRGRHQAPPSSARDRVSRTRRRPASSRASSASL